MRLGVNRRNAVTGLCVIGWLTLSSLAAAQPIDTLDGDLPNVIAYEGYLDMDGNPVNTAVPMVFSLFADPDECPLGTPLWTSEAEEIPVSSGQFAVNLGAGTVPIPTPVFNYPTLYLSVQVGDTVLTACQQITPAPFAQRADRGMPIGAVISWWRPNEAYLVPEGFQICDGSPITDPRSPYDDEETAITTPNLVGQFVRGVATPNQIGTTGGANSFATPAAGSHRHQWADYDGPNRDWYSYNSSGTRTLLRSWENGMDADGSGEYPLSEPGATSHGWYTTDNGSHNHGTIPTVPQYTGLLYLIRIY